MKNFKKTSKSLFLLTLLIVVTSCIIAFTSCSLEDKIIEKRKEDIEETGHQPGKKADDRENKQDDTYYTPNTP